MNTSQYLEGQIWWVAIWNRAISFKEQQLLYEYDNPFEALSLTYPFNVGQELETGGGTLNIAYPPGDLTGKLLVLLANSGAGGTFSTQPGSDWYYVNRYSSTAPHNKIPHVWVKKGDGSETGTVAVDWANGANTGWMIAIDPPEGMEWPDGESVVAAYEGDQTTNSSTLAYYGAHTMQRSGNCLLRVFLGTGNYSSDADVGEVGVTSGFTSAGQITRSGVVAGQIHSAEILSSGLSGNVSASEPTVTGLGTATARFWRNIELQPANTTKIIRQCITENTTAQADNIDETFTGITDQPIREIAPTTNYDTQDWSEVNWFASGDECKTVIKADLSNIPADATILSAQIRYNQLSGVGDNVGYTIEVYRLLRDWVAAQMTWNIYSTGNSWATAGAEGTGDRAADPTFAHEDVADYDGGWHVFDVTDDVIGMHGGEYANYGWVLERLEETASEVRRFNTSNYATATLRPEVIVTYSVPAFIDLSDSLVHQADIGTRKQSVTVPYEHVDGVAGTNNGTLTEERGVGGLLAKKYDDTADENTLFSAPTSVSIEGITNNPHTSAVRASRDVAGVDHTAFGIANNENSNPHYALQFASTDEIKFDFRDLDVVGYNYTTTDNAAALDTEVVFGVRITDNFTHAVFVDGEVKNESNPDTSPADNFGGADRWTWGNLSRGTGPQSIWELDGNVYWSAFWTRLLAYDEIKALADTPNPFTTDALVAETKKFSSLDQNTVHYVPLCESVKEGELMLMLFQVYSSGASSNRVQTAPTGWTLVDSYGYGASNVNNWCGIYKKVATADDAGSYAKVTCDVGAWGNAVIWRIPNGDFNRVEAANNVYTSDQANPNPPSLAHTFAAASASNTLWIAAYSMADDNATATAYPTGFSGGDYVVGVGASNTSCEAGWAFLSSSDTTVDPGAFTISGVDIGTAWTIAVGAQGSAGGLWSLLASKLLSSPLLNSPLKGGR